MSLIATMGLSYGIASFATNSLLSLACFYILQQCLFFILWWLYQTASAVN